MLSLERQNHWREVYRAAHPGWRPATEVFAAEVRDRLGPDTHLLDLGCGRGGLVEQLGHPLEKLAGVDPDFASLREHRLERLPRAVALSEALPFAPARFDVVTASWLLEHLAAPGRTFGEVARVLRPGGAFVFITPNAAHPLVWANRVAGRAGRWQGALVDRLYGRAEADTFRTAYRANTAPALARLLDATGLHLAALHAIADPTYLAFSPLLYRLTSAVDGRLPGARRLHLVGVAVKRAAGDTPPPMA